MCMIACTHVRTHTRTHTHLNTHTTHTHLTHTHIHAHTPQAEQLFHRFCQVKERFRDWVVLGSVDLDSLVDQHCHSVPDWEKNFRALKARGKEAEKLPR